MGEVTASGFQSYETMWSSPDKLIYYFRAGDHGWYLVADPGTALYQPLTAHNLMSRTYSSIRQAYQSIRKMCQQYGYAVPNTGMVKLHKVYTYLDHPYTIRFELPQKMWLLGLCWENAGEAERERFKAEMQMVAFDTRKTAAQAMIDWRTAHGFVPA
jgi:hypothetical protein